MRLAALFSGGKDSTLALDMARSVGEVACLVTLASRNPESYMFHTPNIHLASLQAQAMGMPHLVRETAGVKEEELADLRDALREARDSHGAGGVVTGAIASVYQASRVERICGELGLDCVNPLWGRDQLSVSREVVERGYEAIFVGVFAPPLDERWLGRRLDAAALDELARLQRSHGISPSGEGGEFETLVLDAPFFSRRLLVEASRKRMGATSGVLEITSARLAEK